MNVVGNSGQARELALDQQKKLDKLWDPSTMFTAGVARKGMADRGECERGTPIVWPNDTMLV
jgi:hypothetical protein